MSPHTTSNPTPEPTPETTLLTDDQRHGHAIGTFTDLPNAEKFSVVGDACMLEAAYQDRVRYVPAWKAWRAYADGKWDAEASQERVEQRVEQVLRWLADYAKDEERKGGYSSSYTGREYGEALRKHCTRSFDRVRDIVDAARRRPTLMAHPSDFDTHRDHLNVTNGVVDLVTGALLPHRPEWLMTKQTSVAYNPDWLARILNGEDERAVWQEACPTWMRFLDDVFEQNARLIEWMQRVLGYCITGRTDEEVLLLAYGRGRNGKSTLKTLMAALLGDYAATIKPEALVRQTGNSYRDETSHDPEFSKLVSVRFVHSAEPPNKTDQVTQTTKAGILDEAKMKLITGKDTMSVRPPYGKSFEYLPVFKLLLAVNDLPQRHEHTEGAERRPLVIPFNARFVKGENDDPEMDVKLLAEGEPILAWMVAGAVRWYATHLERPLTVDAPEAVTEANETYRRDSDPYRAFFQDVLIQDAKAHLGIQAGFDAFDAWREANRYDLLNALGIRPNWQGIRTLPEMRRKDFVVEAEKRGFVKRKFIDGFGLKGVRIRTAADRAESAPTTEPEEPGEAGAEPGAAEGPEGPEGEDHALYAVLPPDYRTFSTARAIEEVPEPPPKSAKSAYSPDEPAVSGSNVRSASPKQLEWLGKLGYTGETTGLSYARAFELLDSLYRAGNRNALN